MTPEVLSNYPQIQKLQVAEVVRYLQQNHWAAINHPNPRLLLFEKGVDDRRKAIQIVLPSKDEYEDKPYLVDWYCYILYTRVWCKSFWSTSVWFWLHCPKQYN